MQGKKTSTPYFFFFCVPCKASSPFSSINLLQRSTGMQDSGGKRKAKLNTMDPGFLFLNRPIPSYTFNTNINSLVPQTRRRKKEIPDYGNLLDMIVWTKTDSSVVTDTWERDIVRVMAPTAYCELGFLINYFTSHWRCA